jgi:predicted RecB family nuclease
MIGCGHMEDGEWRFRCFVADDLTESSEAFIIDEWFAHMADVASRLAPSAGDPLVFHWSPAEAVSLETAYRSAKARHPENDWPEPNWFDFLKNVIRAEPVVVRGAMGFGLKAIAQAMHTHGLIETFWEDGPVDGLGAMVGAWHCDEVARREGCLLRDVPLMNDIIKYNHVDCRVMAEVVNYLRQHE